MIRKDLNSQNQFDAGVALSGLSCFISTDLSRDLANDIMTLMSSTKPYLRMKAVLMMYKVFLRYPEALRPAFPKLKEKLEDPDPGGLVQKYFSNILLIKEKKTKYFRRPIGCRKRYLRASSKESEELPVVSADFLQAHDHVHQQLDAHQDH